MTERRTEYQPDRDISDLAQVAADARRHRAPKDTVPRSIPAEGLPPLPVGPTTVTHTEVIADHDTGVPVAVDQYTNTDWVAPGIWPEDMAARLAAAEQKENDR